MITKRIYMAEADQGGASGNPAAPAEAPAEANVTPAQGAAPAFSKEMADAIASIVAKEVAGVKDSIFAEARRTFTEKRNKPKDEPSAAPSAPQALDATEERRVLRDFDRYLARKGLTDKVSPSQWSRAEKALLAERPDDVSAWGDDYFTGYGSPAPSPQPAAHAAAVAPQLKPTNERPVSDRGAPPVSKTPIEEMPLRSLAPEDLKSLIGKIGVVEYRKRLFAELKGSPVEIRK